MGSGYFYIHTFVSQRMCLEPTKLKGAHERGKRFFKSGVGEQNMRNKRGSRTVAVGRLIQ